MKMRKVNRFVVAYIVMLAILAGIGYSVGDYTAKVKKQQEALKANQHFATDVSFVQLPRMNMSISSSSGTTGRIRIDMSLEVEQKNLGRFEDYQPIITDRLVSYVRKLDMEDMRKANAAPKLRQELLNEVNSASYPVPVLDVIFRQFVIM